MMGFIEIRAFLNLKDVKLANVAKETGLNYQQVWRIKSGMDGNPTLKTLEALDCYFSQRKHESDMVWVKIKKENMERDAFLRDGLKSILHDRIDSIIDEMSYDDLNNGNTIEKASAYLLNSIPTSK